VIISLPLAAAFGSFLGNTAFCQSLPFTVTIVPFVIWAGLTLCGRTARDESSRSPRRAAHRP
jgi:hypothetical protein